MKQHVHMYCNIQHEAVYLAIACLKTPSRDLRAAPYSGSPKDGHATMLDEDLPIWILSQSIFVLATQLSLLKSAAEYPREIVQHARETSTPDPWLDRTASARNLELLGNYYHEHMQWSRRRLLSRVRLDGALVQWPQTL